MAVACFGGGLLSTVALFGPQDGVAKGLFLGFSLLLVNFMLDCLVSMLVLKGDPIFSFRRTAAVSLICMVLWMVFCLIGVGLSPAFGQVWWVRLSLLGFSAVLILRLIVFNTTSSLSQARMLTAAFMQPLLCLAPFVILWTKMGYVLVSYVALFLVFSTAVAAIAGYTFVLLLDRVGKKTLGISSFSLLKVFLLNWVLGLNAPFEKVLEELGEEQDVEISLMILECSSPKAAIVVPSVHPGPFKNIGSSILPSLIKTSLEKELDCIVAVPHGLFGHELDLASQAQNRRVVGSILNAGDSGSSEAKASPFVTISNGVATACCQIFGGSVFISFTLAPRTTEDFPKELGVFVQKEAEKHGLACSAVVNAHNSIDGVSDMQKVLGSLEAVATRCLEKVAGLERLPFEVGAATAVSEEFAIADGMGPGGITAVAVRVGEQKTAYVVIDGNNMISGLRERVLEALHSAGFDEAEVFTTDTHVVNAVVLSDRGYHPVGEAMDCGRLIDYIKNVALAAFAKLERVEQVHCYKVTVPKAKVIGAKQLETLCLVTDLAIQKAKRISGPIFALSGIALMLFLMLV